MDLRRFFTHQMWWGKVLCAFLGYLVAGPMGAFFGVFIGNFFDRGLIQHFTNPLWHFHAEKRQSTRAIFFQATFSVLGHIAKAYGRVSEQEIQMAKTLMRDMNLNREQKKMAQDFFNEGKKENFNLKKVLTLLQKSAQHNPNLIKLFIDTQYTAAQLDGLTEKQIQIMNTILQCMHCAPIHKQSRFNDDFYQQSHKWQNSSHSEQTHYHTNPNTTLAGAYAILQVPSTSNKQDIKKAYRRLISRHHPDKLIAQGASKDRVKQANEKTQVIRKAYEQICASKGW